MTGNRDQRPASDDAGVRTLGTIIIVSPLVDGHVQFASFLTVYARRPEVDQGCTDVWCPLLEALDPVVLFLWTGVAMVLALAAAGYVRRASDECENERVRTRAERAAFADFADHVGDIEPTLASAGDGYPGMGETLVQANATDGRLRRVQDAYRETVMAVPHYDEEFGEPLELNMTAELGSEVAPAVFDGPGFTPQLKQALVTKSEEAYRQRLTLENRIDAEESRLSAAEDTFEAVEQRLATLNETPLSEQSFDDLERTYRRLAALEADTRDVVEERQTVVSRELRGDDDEGPTNFFQYLYRPLPVDYPVLADGTTLLETIETAQRNVRLAMTRRA